MPPYSNHVPLSLTISVEKEGIGEVGRMGMHEMRLRLGLTPAVHDLGRLAE